MGQAVIRAETIFDRRGTRAISQVDERHARFFGVWHALTMRHLLQLKRGGQSTLASLDGRGGGVDPVAIDAAIAEIGVWLKGCTDQERYALALEVTCPTTTPVAHGHRLPPTLRPRKQPRQLSRCDVLAAVFGEPFHEAAASWTMVRRVR